MLGLLPLLTRSLSALGSARRFRNDACPCRGGDSCDPRLRKKDSLRFSSSKMLLYMAVMGILPPQGCIFLYVGCRFAVHCNGVNAFIHTAPAFVILLSRIFYKEPITGKKLLCLILTLAGSALVVRIYDPASLFVNAAGIALGLASGVCYSLVTVMGRKALLYCSSTAVATLACHLRHADSRVHYASLADRHVFSCAHRSLPAAGTDRLRASLCCCTIRGFALGVEGGQAGILATIEPVVATLTGVVAFGDVLEGLQIAGIASVLAGAALIRLQEKIKNKNYYYFFLKMCFIYK